ncbi:hypothetical protein BDW59DRAFT_120244 [Aspergillus cavernicola]|uniref:IBR domain-containing protein n=1 Tax=Aspergillus cavernicola TaxID=176166 RepID=A0ABR4HXR5_9EURO
MPGMWPEQNEVFFPGSSLKKRKRDSPQIDVPHSSNNNIRIIPSHLHNFNTAHHSSYTSPLRHTNECSPRRQCLARKRRVLQQQPSFYPPQQPIQATFSQQFHSDAGQNKLLSPTICVATTPNDFSPPVSPRTLAPKLSQQNSCTSASLLRSCHICHRRPTTRELLEAYADCDLCGKRACFVCMRQCDAVDCYDPDGPEDQESWRDTLNSLPSDSSKGPLQSRRPRRICSCCAAEGVTETGIEVVRCLACIR